MHALTNVHTHTYEYTNAHPYPYKHLQNIRPTYLQEWSARAISELVKVCHLDPSTLNAFSDPRTLCCHTGPNWLQAAPCADIACCGVSHAKMGPHVSLSLTPFSPPPLSPHVSLTTCRSKEDSATKSKVAQRRSNRGMPKSARRGGVHRSSYMPRQRPRRCSFPNAPSRSSSWTLCVLIIRSVRRNRSWQWSMAGAGLEESLETVVRHG